MENQELKFASFGQRLLARLIDVIIVGLIAGVLAFILGSNAPDPERAIDGLARGLGMLIFCFIYQPILETTGGTWGKKIVGLRTINLNTGKAPTIGNSYGRSALYFLFILLLVIPAFLSGLAVLWTKKKQTWHDSSTNIAVVVD